MAVDHHRDVRPDCLANRVDAIDAVLHSTLEVDARCISPVDAVEGRDLHGAESGSYGIACRLRNGSRRAVARTAVDVGVNPHGLAGVPAEQCVHRHAGLPCA